MAAGSDTLEALNARLATLVAERQALRASAADAEALERNRREICALQQRIAEALIARYAPAA